MPSRLENIVNSLCEIVINYASTQTSKSYSLRKTLEKDDEALQAIINEATKNDTTRLNLLNYFLFVISQIRPLLSQKQPLSETDKAKVQQHLGLFILNVTKLLKTNQSETLLVEYDNKKERIYGLVRGMMMGYSYCYSGQLLQEKLIAPLGLKDISTQTIKAFVSDCIDEYQHAITVPLLHEANQTVKGKLVDLEERFNSDREKLIEENDRLKQKLLEVEKKLRAFEEANLQEENALLKQKLSALEEKLRLLEEQKPKEEKLREENEGLKQVVSDLQAQLKRLRLEKHLLDDKIKAMDLEKQQTEEKIKQLNQELKLEKEKESSLPSTALNPTPPINIPSSLSYRRNPFFSTFAPLAPFFTTGTLNLLRGEHAEDIDPESGSSSPSF